MFPDIDPKQHSACINYFEQLGKTQKRGVSEDKIKRKSLSVMAGGYAFEGKKLRINRQNITADIELDKAVINAFSLIPGKTHKAEKHFIILKQTVNGKTQFTPSQIFKMPENGGVVKYECWLNQWIDWNNVAATCHTHPYYRGEGRVNNINKRFSNGDPTGLYVKGVPVYMRTPNAKEIKVLELVDNYVTVRRVDGVNIGWRQKWERFL
jgi:hypothetical protein